MKIPSIYTIALMSIFIYCSSQSNNQQIQTLIESNLNHTHDIIITLEDLKNNQYDINEKTLVHIDAIINNIYNFYYSYINIINNNMIMHIMKNRYIDYLYNNWRLCCHCCYISISFLANKAKTYFKARSQQRYLV